jgi:glycosyltransferase 2 family protein
MKWHAFLGILLSVALGAFVLFQMDFHRLGIALHSARYRFLILAAVVQITTHLIRAWRWRYLFEPVKPVPLLPLLSATSIGFMANMLLPAHAGEVVRAYVISRREQVGTMTSLGTIVMERMGDLVSIVLILILVVISPRLPLTKGTLAEGLRIGGSFAAILGGVLIGSLWYLQARTAHMLRLLEYGTRVLPASWRAHVLHAVTAFASGLHVFRNGRHLIAVLVLSLLLWSLIAFSNVLVFWAFGLGLPIMAAFFVLVVQVLSATVPSGPGYIGTFHAAVVAGLAVFDITQELALSMAIMMHATFFLPFIVMGLCFLWGESLSLRDLSAVEAQNLSRVSSDQ